MTGTTYDTEGAGFAEGVAAGERHIERGGSLDSLDSMVTRTALRAGVTEDPRLSGRADGLLTVLEEARAGGLDVGVGGRRKRCEEAT